MGADAGRFELGSAGASRAIELGVEFGEPGCGRRRARNGLAPGFIGRRSKPDRRSSAYCDQLMVLPNSPSLTTSTPALGLLAHNLGDAGGETRRETPPRPPAGRSLLRAQKFDQRPAGRIRLPTWVVRMRSVAAFSLRYSAGTESVGFRSLTSRFTSRGP